MKKREGEGNLRFALTEAPIGVIGLVAQGEELVEVLIRPGRKQLEAEIASRYPSCVPGEGGVLVRAASELREYFAGRRREFTVPCRLSRLSPFAARTLRRLGEVPFGERISYGELAKRCGSAGAARAVGRAMATNPFPLLIPCHRVVGAKGKLTGYSGGEGVATKEWLLAFEERVKSEC